MIAALNGIAVRALTGFSVVAAAASLPLIFGLDRLDAPYEVVHSILPIGWLVLPLTAGGPGSRAVGSDGTVDERGSLGEASTTCGPGAGDGIAPGAVSWVTVRLVAGRYELICNLPGHDAMGMFAELDVR